MRYLALAALLTACHHTAGVPGAIPPAPPPVAAADTLRGTIAITGATPLTQLVLRPAAGGRAVTLTGDTVALRSVAGLDVWIEGTLGDRSFAVARFIVRSAGGLPALDGTIASDHGGVTLITTDGVHHALAATTPDFAARTGTRAWVTAAPDGTVISFGFVASPATPR